MKAKKEVKKDKEEVKTDKEETFLDDEQECRNLLNYYVGRAAEHAEKINKFSGIIIDRNDTKYKQSYLFCTISDDNVEKCIKTLETNRKAK